MDSFHQTMSDYVTEVAYSVARRRERMCKVAYELTHPSRRDRLEQILDMNAQMRSEDPLAGWAVACRVHETLHPLALTLNADDED